MFWRLLRKRRILRAQRKQLPVALAHRYGRRDHYEPEQVRTVLHDRRLTSDWDCYAFAMFCDAMAFDAYHASIGETCSWLAMRGELGLDATHVASDIGSHVDTSSVDSDHGCVSDAAIDGGGFDGGFDAGD